MPGFKLRKVKMQVEQGEIGTQIKILYQLDSPPTRTHFQECTHTKIQIYTGTGIKVRGEELRIPSKLVDTNWKATTTRETTNMENKVQVCLPKCNLLQRKFSTER